jgi:hypothetical protein
MPLVQKITNLPKTWRQLGPETIWLYAKYQLKLRSGWLRLQTPTGKRKSLRLVPQVILKPAGKQEFASLLGNRTQEILAQADELLNGTVHLFGTEPRQLELRPPQPLQHWTKYHSQMPNGEDIKPIWETGRFGWATVLARAYWLSGDEKYTEGFWKYFEEFDSANPPNLGPHWSSAQECALRLISWAFCYSLLATSTASTEDRKAALAEAVIAHAERIPPTLDYARAQNNNHILSEALGLVTAAALVPGHRKAEQWKALGWAEFVRGVDAQVHSDGAYTQHSSNYHRVLLQLGLWATVLAIHLGEPMAQAIVSKLATANQWLTSLLDKSGRVPNLGPNDGAYILPLSVLPFEDFRPALQASYAAFDGNSEMGSGIWDEMALWYGLGNPSPPSPLPQSRRGVPAKTDPGEQGISNKSRKESPIRIEGKNSWVYLRTAEFQERPGHADQLHVDIWWRGLNIAQDAGSYLYTAPAPWDNALASVKVHNTITINDREPMTRAGRFLWLDWAQAKDISTKRDKDGHIIMAGAKHDGYQKLNVIHRREVSWNLGRWVITDRLLPIEEKKKPIQARLHWLLPDWDWQIDTQELRIESPHGEIEISVDVSVGDLTELRVVRAGELLHGSGNADPIHGWASPTYGVKVPALSFIADAVGPLPITIVSTWTLPK